MAFGHGKDARIFVHGFDGHTVLSSVTLALEAEAPGVDVLENADKEYITGLRDATLNADGFFDGADDGGDEVINGLLAGEDKVIAFYPQGDAAGRVGYGVAGELTTYEPTEPIDGPGTISIEMQSSVGAERGVSLQPGSTSVVATGNGATVDNAVATTAGGSVQLHVLDKIGGTNITVEIHHSTDNFAGDDTILATFTVQTTDLVAQRIAIASGTTIKRYVRARHVLGAGGTWRYNAFINRD